MPILSNLIHYTNFFHILFIISIGQLLDASPPVVPSTSKACEVGQECLSQMEPNFESIRDVYPEVCKFLKIGDINNLREVCSSLKQAAEHVLKIRGPEIEVITIQAFLHPTRHISEVIGIKPCLGIFFSNHQIPVHLYDSKIQEYGWSYLFEPHSPMYMVPIIDASGIDVLLNGVQINAHDNDAVGVFFPESTRVKVRRAAIDFSTTLAEDAVAKFLDQVIPAEKSDMKKEPLAMILLYHDHSWALQSFDTILSNFIKTMRERFSRDSQEFSLWGGHLSNVDSLGMGVNEPLMTTLVAITISGEGVRFASKAVSLSQPVKQIRSSFRSLKGQMPISNKLKTIALAITPFFFIHYPRELRKINEFERVFPGIKLMTVVSEFNSKIYCGESTDSAQAEMKYGSPIACFLLISYL